MSKLKFVSEAAENRSRKRKQCVPKISKTREKKWPCSRCDKLFFTKWDATTHIKLVHEKKFEHECAVCGKKIGSVTELKAHTKRHFRDYTFPCKECNKGYVSKVDYDEHYRVTHEGFRYICFPCDKSLKDRYYYIEHMNIHNPNNVPKEIKCKLCDESLSNRYKYNLHMRKHRYTGFVCDICGKKVTSKTSLIDHRKIHTGERPFTCQICGKNFKCNNYLRVHMRVHTKDKPYACEVCGKTFSQPSSLGVHRRLHTGERPFTCIFCHKSCVTRYALKLHMKVHGTALADIKDEISVSSNIKPELTRKSILQENVKNQ